jgi:hypothetical protein
MIPEMGVTVRVMMDHDVPTDKRHVFVRGNRQRTDDVFDAWVEWFEAKGVPFLVAEDPHRTLYKHQTRIVCDEIVTCCEDFDERIEGRDLADEVMHIGYRAADWRKVG